MFLLEVLWDNPVLCLSQPRYACMLNCFSHVQIFATPQTVAHQAPLFVGFSRQEYWSGLPFSSPGDLPDPGIEPALQDCRRPLTCNPGSPALQADLPSLQRSPWLVASASNYITPTFTSIIPFPPPIDYLASPLMRAIVITLEPLG